MVAMTSTGRPPSASRTRCAGPDYDVYVVQGSDRRDLGGGVRLDDLRGNQGTQFYDVPTGADLGDGPWTVLVWCQIFGVPVAHATPA